jgi:hypothetical protein
MADYRLTRTHNRSVVGVIMTEFAYLADVHRSNYADVDLVQLPLRFARTPCGPLYPTHTSPDLAIAAIVR